MSNIVLCNSEYPNIKNIIFDLGGVILNISFENALQEFRKLGFTDIDKFFTEFSQTPLFNNWDKGLTSPQDFREGIRKISGLSLSDEEINMAWNAIVVDIPAERIELLKVLKKKYRTFLLSNTNEIHLEYLFNYAYEKFGIKNFGELFEKPYYSCRVHMRKPDNEIYTFALNDSNLKASETLFIDDSQTNIEAAEKLGIQCFCIKKEESIVELFVQNI